MQKALQNRLRIMNDLVTARDEARQQLQDTRAEVQTANIRVADVLAENATLAAANRALCDKVQQLVLDLEWYCGSRESRGAPPTLLRKKYSNGASNTLLRKTHATDNIF